jgi:acetyl-CoA acetyltransferase
MSNAYVLGLAMFPPSERLEEYRLEEMVYHAVRAALDDAGVSRGQLDHVTLGSCDEFDGRSISSMLMAMPAGAFLTDEIKVTDSAASAFCLEIARLRSGEFELGLVVSWCKSSKTEIENIMRLRGEPFYTRPFGLNMTLTDALFAQGVLGEFRVSEDEINERVVRAYERAARNPRGMKYPVPTITSIRSSAYEATPLRGAQRARQTDGAVCLVMASERWLRRHPSFMPLARVAGVGWSTDSYRLDQKRLRNLYSARAAWKNAWRMARVNPASSLDLVELEAPTAYHEAAYVRAFDLPERIAVSPSGGAFAQNPVFCTGLVNAAEAVLQIAGRAGPVQFPNARCVAAHSCHGYAQQGNVVMIFEKQEGPVV